VPSQRPVQRLGLTGATGESGCGQALPQRILAATSSF
jgi:hypothetical protein